MRREGIELRPFLMVGKQRVSEGMCASRRVISASSLDEAALAKLRPNLPHGHQLSQQNDLRCDVFGSRCGADGLGHVVRPSLPPKQTCLDSLSMGVYRPNATLCRTESGQNR